MADTAEARANARFLSNIRLENLDWRILEELAQRDGMTLSQLLDRLHEELLEDRGNVEHFSSFLRVCCGRYLMLQLTGDIPRDFATPIRSLDANRILEREARRFTADAGSVNNKSRISVAG
ncbi:ribbon-helix-helix domain-containing protein [Bradyrhizobium sp. UFLA05-109]